MRYIIQFTRNWFWISPCIFFNGQESFLLLFFFFSESVITTPGLCWCLPSLLCRVGVVLLVWRSFWYGNLIHSTSLWQHFISQWLSNLLCQHTDAYAWVFTLRMACIDIHSLESDLFMRYSISWEPSSVSLHCIRLIQKWSGEEWLKTTGCSCWLMSVGLIHQFISSNYL